MTNSTFSFLNEQLAPDARADRILAAGRAAFAENGFAATGLSDIARAAGVSMSTLLLHFPSKEELFREVVRSALVGTLISADEGTAASNGDAITAVRAFARQYWSTMERDEMVPLLRLAVGELPRFPELAVFHATETLERYQRVLQRIIEGGVARGELAPLDVRAAARTILAVLAAHAFWFAYPAIYGGLTGSNRETAAEATIDTLLLALKPAVASTNPDAAGR